MIFKANRTFLFFTLILTAICSNVSQAESKFVEVSNTQFTLNGQPYYFVGTNFWYGAYLGSHDQKGNRQSNRERLIKELDLLAKTGITNLRVLAGSEASTLLMAVRPAIQTSPGELDEELLVGLDFLLVEMAKRDMKAILYLTNFWQWSGGMTQYVQWAENRKTIDPDVSGDWDGYITDSASFYQSDSAKAMFRDFTKTIVSRENTLNGIRYTDDPTIMAWELANEPRAGINALPAAHKQPFIDWVDQTAGLIQQLDKNHLVTTGSEGTAGTSYDKALFLDSHRSEHIDYLTVHLWPKNWGWLDAQKPEETYATALENTVKYLDAHLGYAKTLNKPIVLEEFGIERDRGDYSEDNTTKIRDRFFKDVFDYIENKAAQGEAISGSNFWAWGGFGRANHEDFIWQEGDGFTGDPPQEHQGLNSVFDTDKSTLKIIKTHSAALVELIGQQSKIDNAP